MMAKVVMLKMHRDGLIELPPPKWRPGLPKPIVFGPATEPPEFPARFSYDCGRCPSQKSCRRGGRWIE